VTITFCGDNAFAIRHQLQELVTAFVATHGANAVERLDGGSLTIPQLREQVSAITFFAPERLLILKGSSVSKDFFAELGEVVDNVPDGVTLVIVEGQLDKRTRTYKALKAKTDFRECGLLSEREVQEWMIAMAQKAGGELSPQLARLLLERVGNDQWQLLSEIEKLTAWDKQISQETIELLVIPNLEASAFALLDAVMAGREAESQQLLTQMKLRSDPYEFFGLLVWQVHALAMVAYAPAMSGAELAQKSSLKPFVIQKSQQLARRLGAARVAAIVEAIAQLDMQLKSSGIDAWLLVGQGMSKVGRA